MIKLKRYSGETTALYISVLLVFFSAYIIFEISLSLFLLLLIFQLFYILLSQRQFIGNTMMVTENQYCDIDKIVCENAKDLNIKKPKVFITQDPYINAFTLGFKTPYSIVLTSELVESLSRDELDFVIGHEMGHIKFGHSKILSFISPIGRDVAILSWLYGFWQRKAELSADRAGLIVAGKIKPAVSAMLKMTVGKKLSKVVDVDELIIQIDKSDDHLLSRTGEFFLTHPYITNRIKVLTEYYHFENREEELSY